MTSALLQPEPIRGGDELTLLSCLGSHSLPLHDTVREAACVLHMGACVMHTHTHTLSHIHIHTHTEAAIPVWKQNFFFFLPGALASTKYLQHHQLFTASAACVPECVHVPVCTVSRCAQVKSSGSPAPLSEPAFLLLLPGLFSVDIPWTGVQCFIYGPTSKFKLDLFQVEVSCWQE